MNHLLHTLLVKMDGVCDLYMINDEYSIVTGYSYLRACNKQLTSEQREELQAIEKSCFNSRPDRQTRKHF